MQVLTVQRARNNVVAMDILSVVAMNLGFFAQNYAEWRSGGPLPPRRLQVVLGLSSLTDKIRLLALILVSLLVLGISIVALILNLDWLISTIAAALIANAIVQLAISFWTRAFLPGTIAGLTLMLPTAVWAMAAAEYAGGWLAITSGPILSVPILPLLWWLAATISD